MLEILEAGRTHKSKRTGLIFCLSTLLDGDLCGLTLLNLGILIASLEGKSLICGKERQV
jgi:hypothetical protein